MMQSPCIRECFGAKHWNDEDDEDSKLAGYLLSPATYSTSSPDFTTAIAVILEKNMFNHGSSHLTIKCPEIQGAAS